MCVFECVCTRTCTHIVSYARIYAGAKCEVDTEQEAVMQLLRLAACTNRGQSATLDQKYDIENAISDLEFAGSIVNRV